MRCFAGSRARVSQVETRFLKAACGHLFAPRLVICDSTVPMLILSVALLLGIVAGLRAMMAPAAIAWAVKLGKLSVTGTPLAFMGYAHTAWVMLVIAIAELINDQLPWTPSRKTPPQFIGRILSGALVGACVGWTTEVRIAAIVAGIVGAVIGTLGGAAARAKLAAAFGKDLPAALIEDVVGIALSAGAIMLLSY